MRTLGCVRTADGAPFLSPLSFGFMGRRTARVNVVNIEHVEGAEAIGSQPGPFPRRAQSDGRIEAFHFWKIKIAKRTSTSLLNTET